MLDTQIASVPVTYHLSSDFSAKNDAEAYLRWSLTATQFSDIQARCSGNQIPQTWQGALEWASARSSFLYSEAVRYCDYKFAEINPNYWASLTEERVCFEYSNVNQYCDYQVSDGAIAYETTRGTQFWIFKEDGDGNGESFHVALPLSRKGGDHHKSILLAIGGVTNDDRDRWENTYLLPKDTPRETFEMLWGEMKEAYDRVLVPHGFPVMET
jgi:hypothetical protein